MIAYMGLWLASTQDIVYNDRLDLHVRRVRSTGYSDPALGPLTTQRFLLLPPIVATTGLSVAKDDPPSGDPDAQSSQWVSVAQ